MRRPTSRQIWPRISTLPWLLELISAGAALAGLDRSGQADCITQALPTAHCPLPRQQTTVHIKNGSFRCRFLLTIRAVISPTPECYFLSFLWLCRPASACCSGVPPCVLDPLLPLLALAPLLSSFLLLWRPASTCCWGVPPWVPGLPPLPWLLDAIKISLVNNENGYSMGAAPAYGESVFAVFRFGQ